MKIGDRKLVDEFETYEVWSEVVDAGNGTPMKMVSAYNKQGDYIGDTNMAALLADRGIVPELRTKTNRVCSIGRSTKDGKWYGWSHRAIVGFGIGDKLFVEDYGDDNTPFTEHGPRTIKTAQEAKLAAKHFAEYIS